MNTINNTTDTTIETLKTHLLEAYEMSETIGDPVYDIVAECIEDELEEILFMKSFIRNEY